MKAFTIRDFGTRLRQVYAALAREGEAVLTVNGRPVAVLLPTDASTIDETLETVRRARGLEALRRIRQGSQKSGVNRLSTRDIDTIIAKTRRARAHRARG